MREDTMDSEFAQYFSDENFSEKLSAYVLRVGRQGAKDAVILNALILYYSLRDAGARILPRFKAAIVGALGYFIFPFDVIPDLAPVVGFADDLAILTSITSLVAGNLPELAKQRAREKLDEWFRSEGD